MDKVRIVRVVVVGLQVAKHRRRGVESVVGNDDGLSVAQLHERLHVEAVVALRVVALGGDDVGFVGEGLAGEPTDLGVVPAFGQTVADFELVLASAEIARCPRGEIIGQREKDLGAEGLEKGAPAFAGQRGAQRADALRGDDRDALRLARETEEFLVAGRVAFAHGGEVLVFVAEEENLPEILLGVRLDFRNAIEHGALKIELHHDAQSLRESGVHADGEIQGTDASLLDKPGERWQGLAEPVVGVLLGVVALLLRAEDSLHFGVVVEERKEDGNTLNDGGAELRLDPAPIVIEPALDGFQLR